ncbi:hypothetical protein Efla_000368 [Eimeria flavescens]
MKVRWPFERFDGTACKASLKMATSRARMCTNRLQNSIGVQRREIAVLLQHGREEAARLKGEHLLRECRLERAMEILITLCELLISRMKELTPICLSASLLVSVCFSVCLLLSLSASLSVRLSVCPFCSLAAELHSDGEGLSPRLGVSASFAALLRASAE